MCLESGTYIVVKFEKPPNNTNIRHACIPKDWMTCDMTHVTSKKVAIVYPPVDESQVAALVRTREVRNDTWSWHIVSKEYETENYEYAICLAEQLNYLSSKESRQLGETQSGNAAPHNINDSQPAEDSSDSSSSDEDPQPIEKPDKSKHSEKENAAQNINENQSIDDSTDSSSSDEDPKPIEKPDKNNKSTFEKDTPQKPSPRASSVEPHNTRSQTNKLTSTQVPDSPKSCPPEPLSSASSHPPELKTLKLLPHHEDLDYKVNEIISEYLPLNFSDQFDLSPNDSDTTQEDTTEDFDLEVEPSNLRTDNLTSEEKQLLTNLLNQQDEHNTKIELLELYLKIQLLKEHHSQKMIDSILSRHQCHVEKQTDRYSRSSTVSVDETQKRDDPVDIEDIQETANDWKIENVRSTRFEEEIHNESLEEEIIEIDDENEINDGNPQVGVRDRRRITQPRERGAVDADKWTLKYQGPGAGLEELTTGSGIYVKAATLEEYKNCKWGARRMARALLGEIFTMDALVSCSVYGGKPRSGSFDTKPPLHPDGIAALMDYTIHFGRKYCGEDITRASITRSLNSKLYEIRRNVNHWNMKLENLHK